MNVPHAWIKMAWKEENYLPADYYSKLLKKYSFGGREDLKILDDFLSGLQNPGKVLELGCGTGRASEVLRHRFPECHFSMLDLSETMIESVRKKVSDEKTFFFCSDALRFMEGCDEVYDLVFSMWSFSHSIHQNMEKIYDTAPDFSPIRYTIEKFLFKNINRGGKFYIFHFDSQSDEQKILMKQWRRVHPLYQIANGPSHSLELLSTLLRSLEEAGRLTYKVDYLQGDPIGYKSKQEALEIFVNFHLEGALQRLNDDHILSQACDEISKDLEGFVTSQGEVSVAPACYVFEISL